MANTRRTDMAAELLGDVAGELGKERGITVQELTVNGFPVTDVEVLNAQGAELLGRDVGRYLTLSLPSHAVDYGECETVLARLLFSFFPILPKSSSVLVAALGNPDVTPDALGPLCASSLIVSRHLKAADPEKFSFLSEVSLCRPGVLGTSGVESARQIFSFCSLVRPGFVIVLDALACREAEGLCRSIQISDTGIAPGSGVGNDRERIDAELLGVPVISVGVPTVMDAAPFFSPADGAPMFITPRDIDAQVRRLARLISRALNLALHPGLTAEDVEMLLG